MLEGIRQRELEAKRLPRLRVPELQTGSVKENPVHLLNGIAQRRRKVAASIASVQDVADHRMTNLCKVDANLVGASGFNSQAQQRHQRVFPLVRIVGDRTAQPVCPNGDSLPMLWIAAQRHVDGSCRRLRLAVYQSQILLPDLAALKL